MARPRKVRVEGAVDQLHPVKAYNDITEVPADPVPGDNGAALARIVDYFATSFPDEWEGLKLCPLKHGLETMIERLKA